MADAVVVGAGHNGLVAANLLADVGWDVVVLEAATTPGGAVRSAQLTAPGFVSDVFSAFYPLAVASPVIASLRLQEHGLRWVHAPDVLAHPLPDGRAAVLSRQVSSTAASLETFAAGDGQAWTRVAAGFDQLAGPLVNALFRPFPPLAPAARLLSVLGVAEAVRFARFVTLPVRRYGEEQFRGAGGPLLLAGNALHTDLGPDTAGSAVFGWLLAMVGQRLGFPVPQGGAGRLVDALVARLESRGGHLVCGAAVDKVIVRRGRAVAARTADGTTYDAARAVVAAVDAPQLLLELVGEEHLPGRMRDDLHRFQWDNATVKLDWALSGPIPWAVAGPGRAGTVHVGGDMDQLTRYATQLATRHVPDRPLVVLGQMTTADPTRSPPGTESAWGYTHVPRVPRGDAGGASLDCGWSPADVDVVAERIEAQIEAYAPGFRERIVARHVLGPRGFTVRDRSLVDGALNGGTAALHQQLVFRPVPGLGRPELPVAGLYLASSSAHPGGGVHGGPGGNAALAAVRDSGVLGGLRGAAVRAVLGRVQR